MWWIIAIIALWFILIKPIIKFSARNSRDNAQAYNMLSDEAKMLILNEDVFKLASIITECELSGDYRTGNIIMDAYAYKGIGFATRVDRIRNELRIKAGLGPLKNF